MIFPPLVLSCSLGYSGYLSSEYRDRGLFIKEKTQCLAGIKMVNKVVIVNDLCCRKQRANKITMDIAHVFREILLP